MSIRIGIGGSLGQPLAPPDYWRWVELCEEGGIDSIWHSDQLLGPTLEPLVLMAALAARTSRIRFGTNALVVAFRDPVVVAKECAAIDFLSAGRLLPVFGVGGATDAYWAATGANPKDRGRRSNEAIMLIRQLLEQEEVSFQGTHYRYEGPGVFPRPAKPIPLWIGGNSEAAIKRTAALGDGWLGGLVSTPVAAEVVGRIKAALPETGRTIDDDHYGVTLPLRIGSPDDPSVAAARERFRGRIPPEEQKAVFDAFAVGDADHVAGILRSYVEAGISKFVVVPLINDVEDLLQQTDLLARHVLPQVEDKGEEMAKARQPVGSMA